MAFLDETGLAELWSLIGDKYDVCLDHAQIAHGSYIGAGTYGSSNKNTLTFPFVPKLVVIMPIEGTYAARNADTEVKIFIAINGMTKQVGYYKPANTSINPQNTLTWSENTLSWCIGDGTVGTSPTYQMNEADVTYYYVAIG